MMRIVWAAALFWLFGSAFVQAQDRQLLLTDAQLGAHLDALNKLVPDLERTFDGIDPARQPGLDYQTGKTLEYDKQTGVVNMVMIRKAILALRRQRTVYDEVVLQMNLAQIHETLDDLIVYSEKYKALDPFAIGANAVAVTRVETELGNDVMERVGRLENRHCSTH